MTGKLEGDIKLSRNIEKLVNEGVRRRKKPIGKGAVNNQLYLWNDGIVPYETDSVFGECDFRIHYFDNRLYPVSVTLTYCKYIQTCN